MNNKGFAITTALYSLLVMGVLMLGLLVSNLSFERKSTNLFVDAIEDDLNSYRKQAATDSFNNLTIPVYNNSFVETDKLKDTSGNYIRPNDEIKIASNVNSNYVLYTENNVIAPNTNISVLTRSGDVGQVFRIIKTTDSRYNNIVQGSNNYALNVKDNSTASGANVLLYLFSNATGEQWSFISTNRVGVYIIKSRLGNCLNLTGGVATNLQNVQVTSCNQSSAQQWMIVKNN